MVFRVPALTRLPRWAGRLGGLGAWLLLGACGPSFEVLAEGDLRFAHCDRLDLDPKIAPSHRLHCWREWRRMYTYGQTRDRVEYAARRIAEVVSGDTESPIQLPTEERFGPRPGVANRPGPAGAGGLPVVASATTAALSPEELACRGRCEAAHAACSPGCETRPTGCQRCEQPLEACLGGCKTDAP